MRSGKYSLTKHTRGLGNSPTMVEYAPLISVLMVLAEIADSPDEKATDRRQAAVEWHRHYDDLEHKIAAQIRETTWANSRPRAV